LPWSPNIQGQKRPGSGVHQVHMSSVLYHIHRLFSGLSTWAPRQDVVYFIAQRFDVYSARRVTYIHSLGSLENEDREFEFHFRPGCIFALLCISDFVWIGRRNREYLSWNS
jgi:hypothetical protein